MKLILPDAAKLDCKRNEKGEVSFTYLEYFERASPETHARTMVLANKLIEKYSLPIEATTEDAWIGFRSLGYVSARLFYSMMESEFFAWIDATALEETGILLSLAAGEC